MYEYKVEFFPVVQKMKDELSDEFFKYCSFCNKQVLIKNDILKAPKNLIDGEFFCKFCFRKNISKKKIIIFSFKNIISSLYMIHKDESYSNKFYKSQIDDYIEAHKQSGLKNYALDYDDESYCWFLDLDCIGNEENQVPLVEFEKTLIEMISCFNLYFFNIDGSAFYVHIKQIIQNAVKNKDSVTNPMFISSKISTDRSKIFTTKLKNR